jgi:SAM-dependent methyltransferase
VQWHDLTRAPLAQESATGRAFEEQALTYDERFTNGALGRLLRARAWRRFDACFAAAERVLDIGCGTGEDAVYLARRGLHVVALDASAAMVAVARQKALAAGLADRIDVRRATIESLAAPPASDGGPLSGVGPKFDGALSNFGALNCCAPGLLPAVARGLAPLLKPGSRVLLVVMGPLVPWEWLWLLSHGERRNVFRRLRADGVRWHDINVHYPSIRTVRRAFSPAFRYRRASGLGCFVPPTYAQPWALRHARVLGFLDRCERRLEGVAPIAWLSDHYILELERR